MGGLLCSAKLEAEGRGANSMIKRFLLLSDKAWSNMKKSIAASAVAHFSMILLSMVTSFAFWYVLQPFLGGTVDWRNMWILFGVGIAAMLIVHLLHIAEYNRVYISGNAASSEKRISVAEHMRRLPLSFFEHKNLTDLASNIMADCFQIETGFTSLIPSLIGNLISILFTCIMLSLFDWRMALAVFVTTPISFGIILLTTRLQKKIAARHYDTGLKMDAAMQEYLEGIKVTKAFGLSGQSYHDLEKACLEMKRVNMRTEVLAGTLASFSTILLRIGTPITIYVGVSLLTAGTLDPVYLLFFLLISTRIYGSLAAPLSMWGDVVYAGVALGRLRDLYEQPVMEGSDQANVPNHEISFENVSFSYNTGEEVLSGLNFQIPQGKVTALVGPSGSGKSTVARLAARFWDADSGKISLGGVPVKDIDPERLLSHVSYVFQDVVLFNDSVFGNIKIGKKDATNEEVLAAAKVANCDCFISRMPEGYDTVIGENGSTLSGGERQRISIARAILKNAPVVILDEATAALDPENEVEIQEALSKLTKDKTTLVIAHRLRTVTDSDQIIVLDKGRVAEQGDHDALMQKAGLYARMYNIQQKSLGWTV